MIECAGIYYDEPSNCPPDGYWEYEPEAETPAEQGKEVDTQN